LKGGDHLHDFSPENNHGTINGAKWKDGRYGWALDFDGSDDYVEVPDTNELRLQPPFTISYWLKTPSVPGYMVTVDKDFNSSWGVFIFSDGSAHNIRLYSGGTQYNINSNTGYKSFWNKRTITMDETGLVKWFYNGDPDGSTDTGITSIDESTAIVSFGSKEGTSYFYNGTIAIVRIYLKAKSSSWISRRFERTKGIFGL